MPSRILVLCVLLITSCIRVTATDAPREIKDIAYVEGGHAMQRLDLFLPTGTGPHPLIVYVHGDQDPQMPLQQAHELHARYQKLGLPVEFHIIPGAAHGGAKFYDDERTALMSAFLTKHLPAKH